MHERELKMHKRFRLILRGGITLHKKCKTKLEWQEDELHNRYQASERRIEIFTAFHDSYHDKRLRGKSRNPSSQPWLIFRIA